MAKDYEVLWGFQCPSLDRWISPDTAYLVPRMADKELDHAMAQGYIREVTLPAGVKSIREAQAKADDDAKAREQAIRKDEEKRSARAIEEAKEESGSSPTARVKGGSR